MLNTEEIVCSDLSLILYLEKLCHSYAPLDLIRKWLCYFVMNGHGKLDLRFVHGRAEKMFFKWSTYLRPKSPRKMIEPRVLEKRVCLFADTFSCVSNCYRK